MQTFIIYTVSAISLLVSSYLCFRILFRRDFYVKAKLSPLSILAGTLVYFLWGGFPYLYGIEGWPDVKVSPIQEIAGKVVLFGGLALMLLSIASLGFMRSLGQQQTKLVQIGPYRFSRNPQVVGVVLYGIGFTLLWPSWYTLGWALMILPMLHWMVLSEEEHLGRVFGEAYQEYSNRVRRYI